MNAASFAYIPLDHLSPNEYNARRFVENMTPQRLDRFNELVASVREKGIIEPLLVRPISADRYEIIAGERRFRSALQVAETTADFSIGDYQVPCMIRNVNDDDAFDLMIIENMQRDDLTPFETAQAFAAYLEHHGNKAEAAATLSMRTGIPVHAIRRQVRLLEVPTEVIAAWKAGSISMSHVEMFTRVGDREQILELLAACQRNKLSTRELAERIGAAAPDLERGFFDKEECQVCGFNTSVQSGLFADNAPGGKCGNAACFEAKQGAFLTENWGKSKAATLYATTGFRFGHRAPAEMRSLMIEETADRCTVCDCFISLVRLTGAVVSGYDRTCIGPRACFDEIYRQAAPAVSPPAAPAQDSAPLPTAPAAPVGKPAAKAATKPAAQKSPAPAVKPEPPKAPEAVFNAARGEKARETFLRSVLPDRIRSLEEGDSRGHRLAILAMGLASSSAKNLLIKRLELPANCAPLKLAETIFDDLELGNLYGELREAALAQLLDHGVSSTLRGFVAVQCGINLATAWEITREYLDSLTKGELISIGEEPGVALWVDETLQAYRKEQHQGKALLSLSKDDLVDLVMKSGVSLTHRVPAEVVGRTPLGNRE